jgi:hypothetical protein
MHPVLSTAHCPTYCTLSCPVLCSLCCTVCATHRTPVLLLHRPTLRAAPSLRPICPTLPSGPMPGQTCSCGCAHAADGLWVHQGNDRVHSRVARGALWERKGALGYSGQGRVAQQVVNVPRCMASCCAHALAALHSLDGVLGFESNSSQGTCPCSNQPASMMWR